jgi:hypothetical protein
MNPLKTLLLIIGMLVLFLSCKKEDIPYPQDNNLRLVKQIIRSSPAGNSWVSFDTINYEYDLNNCLVKVVSGVYQLELDYSKNRIIDGYLNNGTLEKNINDFKVTSPYAIAKYGAFECEIALTYDDSGYLAEATGHDRHMQRINRYSYSEGNLTSIATTYPEVNMEEHLQRFEYTDKLNHSNLILADEKALPFDNWFPGMFGTANKNLIKLFYYENTLDTVKFSYQFDEKGFITEIVRVSGDTVKMEVKY